MTITKHFFVLMMWIAAFAPTVSAAAQILEQGRSLQAIVDAVDYNPLAGDEVADFSHAPGFGSYSASISASLPFNSSFASASADQNTLVDAVALRFSGSGSATSHIDTRFDAADVTAGAFASTIGNSHFMVRFKLVNSGKVRLTLALDVATSVTDAIGVPLALAKIQTSLGAVMWSQLITANNTMTFDGEVLLASGEYQLIVTAAHNISDARSGARTIDSRAAFVISGSIIEDARAGSGKPGRRK